MWRFILAVREPLVDLQCHVALMSVHMQAVAFLAGLQPFRSGAGLSREFR
jgi:hypothetical protein